MKTVHAAASRCLLSTFPRRLNETGAALTHTHISIDSGPPGRSL